MPACPSSRAAPGASASSGAARSRISRASAVRVVGHLVTPVLTAHAGEQTDEEGCLSLPGLGY
ncbi:hypothetical protein AB0C31_52000, partial [Actinoplanes philippinensis]